MPRPTTSPARSTPASEALGVDYVDLLLIHWPQPQVPMEETLGALAKAKRDGLARHVGVSNFTVALIDEAVESVDRAAGHQPDRVPRLYPPGQGARRLPHVTG